MKPNNTLTIKRQLPLIFGRIIVTEDIVVN